MLKSVLATATFKQSQITIIATLINGFLGFLFLILLARLLGPANLGIFTISTAILTLVADIVDFGTNTGLIRFVSASLAVDKEKAYKFLKLSLEIKCIAWIGSFLIIFFLSPFLATQVFYKSELIIPLPCFA